MPRNKVRCSLMGYLGRKGAMELSFLSRQNLGLCLVISACCLVIWKWGFFHLQKGCWFYYSCSPLHFMLLKIKNKIITAIHSFVLLWVWHSIYCQCLLNIISTSEFHTSTYFPRSQMEILTDIVPMTDIRNFHWQSSFSLLSLCLLFSWYLITLPFPH